MLFQLIDTLEMKKQQILKKPPDCSGAVTSACVIIKRTLWPLHIDCHHLGAFVALDAGVVHSIGFDIADWDIFTELVFQLRSSFVVKFTARVDFC